MPIAHLTDVAICRLKEPGIYLDKATPAFGLRVGKHKKSWIVVRGTGRIRTRFGHYPTMSLADARKEARRLLTEQPTKGSRITFEKAYDGFKEAIAGKKPRTQRGYKRIIDKYFLPKFKSRKLPTITYEEIDKIAKPLAKGEQRHLLAVGRTFFRWCVKPPRRYIDHSPLEGVSLPKARKRKRTLEPDEIKKIWNAAKDIGYPYGTIIQILILTGQRRNEIANLRWSWIDFKEKTITLPDWVTKNSKEHVFPYGQMVTDILTTVPRLNSTDLLFPSRVSESRPLSGWSKYRKQLKDGVSGWWLHDLRRTCRTIHGQLGTSSSIGERLINHAAAVTTDVEEIYDRWTYLPEMRAAVEKYEAHIALCTAA